MPGKLSYQYVSGLAENFSNPAGKRILSIVLCGIGTGTNTASLFLMPRSHRYQIPFSPYHIMNRGQNHRPIVFDQSDFHIFLKGVEEIHRIYSIEIYAFCLMTNHFHLLVAPTSENLSRAMRHFSHTYTQRINRKYDRDGPLFRGRFKSIIVADDAYFLQVLRYIHLNPSSANLTLDPMDYPWSSESCYRGKKSIHFLNTNNALLQFHENLEIARIIYSKFIAEGNQRAIENFYANKRHPSILGSDSSIRALERTEKIRCESLPGT